MKLIEIFIVINLYFFNLIESNLLNKNEGEKCKLVSGEEWTCQILSSCPQVGDFRRSRPDICGFKGKEPIICCPPNEGAGEEMLSSNGNIRTPESSQDKSPDALEYSSNTSDSPVVSIGDITPSPFPDKAPYSLKKCIEYEVKLCIANQLNRPSFVHSTLRTSPNLPLTMRMIRDVSPFESVKFTPVVVGGKAAEEKQFPFVAVIGFGEEGHERWECGGSVVSHNWILSAAHCAQSMSGLAKWIGVGGVDINADGYTGMILSISKIVIHPDYKPPAMYNDIALFKSNYKIGFNEFVRPTCLHPLLVIPKNASVAGWGTTEFGGAKSSKLLFVDLKTIDPSSCQRIYNGSRLLPRGFDSETMLCAGETKADACTGDSGGPLYFKSSICLHVQLGIVSFGRNCGIYPGVYTRVSHYISWIENIVWPVSERTSSPVLPSLPSPEFGVII